MIHTEALTSRRLANRKLPPSKYIVFDRDDLYRIIADRPGSIADNLYIAVVLWFIYAGYMPTQLNLAMEEWVIGYHTRRAAIDIRRSILDRKELPEEVSFVIGRGV